MSGILAVPVVLIMISMEETCLVRYKHHSAAAAPLRTPSLEPDGEMDGISRLSQRVFSLARHQARVCSSVPKDSEKSRSYQEIT